MFKHFAITTLLLSSCAFAADKPSMLPVEEFLDKHVAQSCGYWIEREVEVCDERIVYDREAYKQCNYTRNYTTSPAIFPTSYSVSIANNAQCDYSKTLGAPGHTPHAVYYLSNESILYREVARTERFNCRTELRMVWVPGNPRQCQIPAY